MSRLWILLLLLANWINSPVLSAKAGKKKHQVKNQSDFATPKEDVGSDGARESTPESDFLADFSGKHRLWVITAPSHGDNYLRMMEKQIQESEGLNCRLAERDTLVVTIIQNAMMEGKIQRTTLQGEAIVEAMDSEMVSKLLHYLEVEDHTFSMLILKKNMRVSERFPYPVRVEAILEVIDQLPVRKLEKVARKGLPVKCKITKKRLVMKKQGSNKRRTFSPQRQLNTTSILTQKIRLDKKATLRNKVQDILSGRSRFIIRKTTGGSGNSKPSAKAGSKSGSNGKHDDQKKTPDSDRNRKPVTEVKKTPEADKTHASTKSNFDTLNENFKGEQTVDHSTSKNKGKGKDGKKKKGKGGRRKSQREADDKEKAALKEFMQNLKGRRRLLVISSPSDVSSQYIKQRDDNELCSCEFSQRKVSVLSIMGSERSPTLHIQHYQDSEPLQASLPEKFRNPELISEIRREYGLDSKNFSMVLTDYDLRPNLNRVFSKPTAPSDLLDYIDGFPSRQSEKEEERKAPSPCSKDETNNQENSLLRFMSKRRLLIISAPTVDDYSFHQQLQALNGQECPMGIRHFALLKIVGTGSTASGTVEFFPLNGKSQPEKETLSQDVVEGLRNQLKINRDYFSMLVVGKDGDVKAWFPSPMWSLGSIYDLVDSMELRQQEQKLQQTLGIHCPDENTGTYHGYTEETEDSYLYHRSED
ncbi:coiled-coil domain-containing protein 80 [Megalobrama amblycephala]|uniref:coiled-coil domain-containing protein 80 n=1 Tax=Megalobrama amblycephala TaxID=75352 RepID=UPI0020142C2F|nr:coiled-coil domain-containing protein 80 [Megalobrama amblycephala]